MFILNYIVSRRDQTNDIHLLSGIHLERFECNRFGGRCVGRGEVSGRRVAVMAGGGCQHIVQLLLMLLLAMAVMMMTDEAEK